MNVYSKYSDFVINQGKGSHTHTKKEIGQITKDSTPEEISEIISSKLKELIEKELQVKKDKNVKSDAKTSV